LQHFSLGNKDAYSAAEKAFELRKDIMGQEHVLTLQCKFAMADSLKRQYR